MPTTTYTPLPRDDIDDDDIPHTHSSSTQPLIDRPSTSVVSNNDNDSDGTITLWIWLLTLTAGISGLLFGYDTASISAALLHLTPSLSTPSHPVTTWDKSLITSSTSLGALLGGLFAGLLADKIGRKRVVWVADVLFVVGALGQAFAGGVWELVVGRTVVGVGVGVGSLIVPLYISELSPPTHRGRLVVINVLFITLGQLLAYTVGLLLSPPTLPQDTSWRFILGLGAVPAVFQAAFMTFMPESPRWLIQSSRRGEAADVVRQVYGADEAGVESVLAGIEAGVEAAGEKDTLAQKLRTMFSVPGNRRALTLSCLLQALQQACGFNALMYYAATIFSLIGVQNPVAVSMVVAGTNMLATAAAFALIDRVGRRRILLWSIPGMAVGLGGCAVAFQHLPMLKSSGSSSEPAESVWTPLLIVAMMSYVASYALGVGAIPWVVQSEFFPMRVRGLGTGMATATNWALNFVVGVSFLPAVEGMWGGAVGLFVVYAAVCGVGWVAVWGVYPETRGLRMEEIEGVLRGGWGVKRGEGEGEDGE